MNIKEYIEMLKKLKEYGENLINKTYREEDNLPQWVDEVECMDMHLECALTILEQGV